MKAIWFYPFALLFWAVQVFASVSPNVIVSSPGAGATVGTPFVLNAATTPCSGQPVSATGFSIDAGATTIVNAASINAQVTAPVGSHTLHVKSWGNLGAGCDTDVSINVSAAAIAPLFTDVAVSQPVQGVGLVSPFTLAASGTQCQSQPISAMGFSIDDSSATMIVNGGSLNSPVSSVLGSHTLHVKSWGIHGSSCVSNVLIIVVPSPVSTLPSSAIGVYGIQTMMNWQATIDSATSAGASTMGATKLSGAPTLSGTSREFATNFAGAGGERYDVSFGADTSAANFLYDAWIYLPRPSTNIANLEFDVNQVMANGNTVIFGLQCDYWSKTWDYTANAGTVKVPIDVWLHSNASCNVQSWSTNTWHHVQIRYSHDGQGNVTYQAVWLDNVQQGLNITVPDAFALGWSPTLLTNFQVDSMIASDTTSTVYLDNLTVYRW